MNKDNMQSHNDREAELEEMKHRLEQLKKQRKNVNERVERREIENKRKFESGVVDEITVNIPQEKVKENVKVKVKKKKKKKTSGTRKILKFILAMIIIFVVAILGLFIKRMNENGWTMGGFVATILGHDSKTLANLPRLNILVVGQSQNLTDTLLICSYDPKAQEAALISIPRDTFIGNSRGNANSFDKINALYQIDPDKLVKKVNELTGLDITWYVKVDTEGLRELVDSVGGIYFDVPIDMDYDDSSQDLYIHVKKGYQLLDGEKAEQVVRFRHNNDGTTYPASYGEQDIGRMRTQREFLTEVIKQVVKPENIKRIDDYIKIANKNVSSNFSIWNLKDYAPYLIDFKTENMETATLPGVPEKINNLWFYSVNKKEAKKLVADLLKTGETVDKEQNANIKINILNGTKDETKLSNVKNILKESGYTIVSTGTTTPTKNTTIINRTNKDSDVANKLKEIIGVGMVANSSSSNNTTSDFTVIIGDDY